MIEVNIEKQTRLVIEPREGFSGLDEVIPTLGSFAAELGFKLKLASKVQAACGNIACSPTVECNSRDETKRAGESLGDRVITEAKLYCEEILCPFRPPDAGDSEPLNPHPNLPALSATESNEANIPA